MIIFELDQYKKISKYPVWIILIYFASCIRVINYHQKFYSFVRVWVYILLTNLLIILNFYLKKKVFWLIKKVHIFNDSNDYDKSSGSKMNMLCLLVVVWLWRFENIFKNTNVVDEKQKCNPKVLKFFTLQILSA